MFKLVIQDDEGKTTVVPLIRDEITIGRKEGNTIRLTERNVSRRHARIVRSNGEVQIEDLGSYNGIRVNNARIAERVSLRVSDQVQIGDYKLYLKAEGVEQVDDARTMPIERVDSPIATEIMPAVSPSSPTVPISAQAAAAAAATTGRPAVSGTGDTDPAGRPVATAAQVAALSASAAYGKLVVLSSNFPGKEFDLTRPQMIIGRTDENDIVVNHRSISRNHAKITRDPETSRYTISDLQSSNGVRVNGQDYGKVELRRGDTVDLGHVRLRFVEPGEEFLFSHAMVTDVAEPGGKKGLLVAIVLGLIVLLGVGAFLFLKKGDDDTKKNGGNLATGNDHVASGDNTGPGPGPDVASEHPGSAAVAVAPTNPGSAGTVQPPGDDNSKLECLNLITEKKWQDLDNCARKYQTKDPDLAQKWLKQAKAEQQNDVQVGKLEEAVRQGDLGKARRILDKIDDDSVYKPNAKASYDGLAKQITEDLRGKASRLAAQHKCSDIEKLAAQAQSAQGPEAAEAVRSVKCEAAASGGGEHVAVAPKNPPGGGNNAGSATPAPPPANCDADALAEKGSQDEAIGQHAAALSQYENAFKCKPSDRLLRLAFMASCNAGNVGKAKTYYKKLATNPSRGTIAQMCVRAGIKIEQLDAP
jgi:pSer/pThr/pTyr-binding forkhead associated (FHA) protein